MFCMCWKECVISKSKGPNPGPMKVQSREGARVGSQAGRRPQAERLASLKGRSRHTEQAVMQVHLPAFGHFMTLLIKSTRHF